MEVGYTRAGKDAEKPGSSSIETGRWIFEVILDGGAG